MTLVEVVVAIMIFAIMASSILTVIVNANNFSNRSRMRDKELAGQATIASKKASAQMSKIGDVSDGYSIVFTPEGASAKTVGGVYAWETDDGEYSKEFGFQIKTFAGQDIDNDLNIDPANLFDDEYAFLFHNDHSEEITIKVTINDGLIFEGSRGSTGYKHPAQTYTRTIRAGGDANFGFYLQNYTGVDTLIIEARSSSYASKFININPSLFDPDKRTVKIGFEQASPTDPGVEVVGPEYVTD